MSQEHYVGIVETIAVSTMFVVGLLMIVLFKLHEIQKSIEGKQEQSLEKVEVKDAKS